MAVSGTVAIRVGGDAGMGDCCCRVCTLGDAGMRTGERSVRRGAGTERSTLGDATGGGCMAVPVWVTDAVASAPLEMWGCGRASVASGGALVPSAAPLEMLPALDA